MTRFDYFPMARGPCEPGAGIQGGWQITSYFGTRTDPITGRPGSGHGGQDLAYSGCRGVDIFAPMRGTVSMSWDSSGGGNWAGITGDDGSYCGIGHNLDFVGPTYRRVEAGELIAHCDSTGGSTGSHVHIAYRAPGASKYSDPWPLLEDSQHRCIGDPDEGVRIHTLTGAAVFLAFGPNGAALVGTGYWCNLDEEGYALWSAIPGMVVHEVDQREWDVLHAGATHGQSADDPLT